MREREARDLDEKLGKILKSAGAGFEHVVQTTEYVTTTENYGRTAAVRRGFFGDRFPTATGVIVAGLLREDRDVVFGDQRIGTVSVYATPRFVEEELRVAVEERADHERLGLVAAAAHLDQSMGKRVSLHYQQHRGLPTSCFALSRSTLRITSSVPSR